MVFDCGPVVAKCDEEQPGDKEGGYPAEPWCGAAGAVSPGGEGWRWDVDRRVRQGGFVGEREVNRGGMVPGNLAQKRNT